MGTPRSNRVPRRLRVLLVDDEPAIRRAVQRLLAQEFDVIGAEGVSEALALLANGSRFDGLIVDLYMPEANGRETLARIREVDAALADRAIVLTTGAHEAELHEWCKTMGDAVLLKPPTRAELSEMLRTQIAQGRKRRAHA